MCVILFLRLRRQNAQNVGDMMQSSLFGPPPTKRPGVTLTRPGRLELPSNPVWVSLYTVQLLPAFAMMRRAFYSPFGRPRSNAVEAVRLAGHLTLLSERIMKEIHIMAEKKKPIAVLGWVNMPLADGDKEHILDLATDVAALLSDFSSLVFRGYRLSITWDDYSNALQASLVCADPESQNAGYGVSARHPDMDTVLATLWFKVSQLGETPWSEFTRNSGVSSWS